MLTRVSIVLAVVLMASTAPAAMGQMRAATASLSGTVSDSSGAVIPGARTTLTNLATGEDRELAADSSGRFVMPALPVGSYRLRVEADSFAPRVFDQIDLTVGSETVLDVELSIAGGQETVIVVGSGPLVDLRKTEASTLIAEQQITMLPINGRNFMELATLAPGATLDRGATSVTTGLSFAGQRGRSNNISLDGVDNIDPVVGSVRAGVSQDAVQEFQVVPTSFSAEFGKASGGVVNIVTRSGSNALDGQAFLFARDTSLNARGYFDDVTPSGAAVHRDEAPFDQQQFGATLGGPIRRNRTFFFVSVERQQTDASRFVSIDDETLVPNPFGPGVLGTTADILRQNGFAFDTGNVPYIREATLFLGKVDHELTPLDRLSVRALTDYHVDENVEPWGGVKARSFAAELDSRDWEVSASWTRVHSQRLLNDLRVQFSDIYWDENSLDPACGGPCITDEQGGPSVEIAGIASVGRQNFLPSHSGSKKLQFVDTISYFRKQHDVKTGVDIGYRRAEPVTFPLNVGGRYFFVDLPDEIAPLLGLPHGISAIQALAIGLPGAYVQAYGSPLRGEINELDFSAFVQDDWHVSPNLTLKGGLRLQQQHLSPFDYDDGQGGTFRFTGGGLNVSPRVAMAWAPSSQRHTSIRAAYGMFFDHELQGPAGIAQVVQPATGLRTLSAVGLPAFTAWQSPGRRLPEAYAGQYPSLKITIDPGFKTPYAHQALVGIDREIGHGVLVSANGVFTRGFRQLGLLDYNPLVPELGPGRRPDDVGGVPGTSNSVFQYTSFGETWYKGLWVSLSRRFNQRYQAQVSYTLSSAKDNVADFSSQPDNNGRGRNPSDPTGTPLGFDPYDDRGPALSDARHQFVASGSWLAPAGIFVSSIMRFSSGLPFDIRAGYDANGDGVLNNPDRARTNPLDPTTEIGRNAGRLPAQATVDLRVSRRFPLRGKLGIEAILDIFNLFNRANFTDVNGVFGPGAYPQEPLPTFGQLTQTGPPRQVQIAGRLSF